MNPQTLLVLGASNSGKTVLSAQLYGRARYTPASLTLRAQASDIQVLDHAFRSLQRGMLPSRTAETTFGTVTLPLISRAADSEVVLVWPDYGGEQFNRILESRQLPAEWEGRTREAQGTLLLIRPKLTFTPPDVLTRPGVREADGSAYGAVVPSPDDHLPVDSMYVELLQLLTSAKGLDRLKRFKWPLTVALTCWDEVAGQDLTPGEQLQKRMPLLWQYLQGAWSPSCLHIVGVSALARPLRNEQGLSLDALPPDEQFCPADATPEQREQALRAASDREFRSKTPQDQGYLVTGDGQQIPDLTLLIEPLLTVPVQDNP